jgi:hypothetical protein
MKRLALRVLSGAAVCAVLAEVSGCATKPSTGFGVAAGPAVAIGSFPANATMTRDYGIVEWRLFVGAKQYVITGFRPDGSPARGVQVAWFAQAGTTLGHLRLTMLDGTLAAVRRYVGGATTGALTENQVAVVLSQIADIRNATTVHAKGALRTVDVARVGSSDLRVQDAPDTGPECTSAQGDAATNAVGCAGGSIIDSPKVAGPIGFGIGVVNLVNSCLSWAQSAYQASGTCSQENAIACQTNQTDPDNPVTNCNFDGGDPFPYTYDGGLSQSELCANYPSSPGCNMNVGPCTSDTECSGGETCQPSTAGGSGKTCQPAAEGGAADAAADDGGSGSDAAVGDAASGDDGGSGDDAAGGDDASSGSGDDASAGSGDDGGGRTDTGDDAGGSSGDDGDDAGAGTTDPPTDQEIDSASSDSSCPSCDGTGSDLTVNPQNGDVTIASSGTGGSSGSSDTAPGATATSDTSDTSDPGASTTGASSSGGTASSGSSSGDDETTSSSGGSGDDGTSSSGSSSGDDGTSSSSSSSGGEGATQDDGGTQGNSGTQDDAGGGAQDATGSQDDGGSGNQDSGNQDSTGNQDSNGNQDGTGNQDSNGNQDSGGTQDNQDASTQDSQDSQDTQDSDREHANRRVPKTAWGRLYDWLAH